MIAINLLFIPSILILKRVPNLDHNYSIFAINSINKLKIICASAFYEIVQVRLIQLLTPPYLIPSLISQQKFPFQELVLMPVTTQPLSSQKEGRSPIITHTHTKHTTLQSLETLPIISQHC